MDEQSSVGTGMTGYGIIIMRALQHMTLQKIE